MSHKRPVTVLRRFWIGYVAIGLAGVVGVVPASFAQDPRVLDHGKIAGRGIEAEEPQTRDQTSDGPRSEAREQTGVVVAVPIGRVLVGPEFVDGEPIYERRAARERMTTVEFSTTPFMPEPTGVDELILRPDQPAPW